MTNIKRVADGSSQRRREIVDEREISTEPTTNPCETSRQTRKGATFVILKNHASAPVRKERLSPTNKARRKEFQNKLLKTAGCQAESKTLEKSIVSRIVRELDLRLLNPSVMN